MFRQKVFNEKEILACLKKAEKRKGRQVRLGDVPSGSLVRWKPDSYSLTYVTIDDPDEFNDEPHVSTYDAYSHMFDGVCMGFGAPLKKCANQLVTLVMDAKEVVQPKKESPIKTSATITTDGLIHCQNFIFGNRGQHFVVSRAEFEEIKADGREIVSVENGDCGCGLGLGEVREYDGRTWKNDRMEN